MKNIIVQYGSKSHPMNIAANATLRTVLNDYTAKVILGFGDNVHGLIGGVAQPDDVVIPDGAVVLVENKANSKA